MQMYTPFTNAAYPENTVTLLPLATMELDPRARLKDNYIHMAFLKV